MVFLEQICRKRTLKPYPRLHAPQLKGNFFPGITEISPVENRWSPVIRPSIVKIRRVTWCAIGEGKAVELSLHVKPNAILETSSSNIFILQPWEMNEDLPRSASVKGTSQPAEKWRFFDKVFPTTVADIPEIAQRISSRVESAAPRAVWVVIGFPSPEETERAFHAVKINKLATRSEPFQNVTGVLMPESVERSLGESGG